MLELSQLRLLHNTPTSLLLERVGVSMGIMEIHMGDLPLELKKMG